MATNTQHLLHSLDGAIAYYEKIHTGWLRSAADKAPTGAKPAPFSLLSPIGNRAAVLRGGFTLRAGHRDKRAELVWLILTLREIRLWVAEQARLGAVSFEPTAELAKVLGPTVYTGGWSRQFDTDPEPAYEARVSFGWEARLPDRPFAVKTYLKSVRAAHQTSYTQINYGGRNQQGLTVVKGMTQAQVNTLVTQLRTVLNDEQLHEAAVKVAAKTSAGERVVDAVKDVLHGFGVGADWFNRVAELGINAAKIGMFLAALRGGPLPPV